MKIWKEIISGAVSTVYDEWSMTKWKIFYFHSKFVKTCKLIHLVLYGKFEAGVRGNNSIQSNQLKDQSWTNQKSVRLSNII